MFKFGVCVKECPTADKTKKVECSVSNYMLTGDKSKDYIGCEYQIGADFFASFGLDFSEYTKDIPDVVTDTITENAKYPFRYDSKSLYTFCVP